LQLERLAYGELAGEERAALEQHLAGCEACTTWVASVCAEEEARPAEASARFAEALVSRLAAEERRAVSAAAAPRRGFFELLRERWLWFSAAGVAAAAAVLAVALLGGPSALPDYALELGEGSQRMMGSSEGAPPRRLRVDPGALLELRLRPSSAVEGKVTAQLYLARGGALTPVAVPLERDEQGSLRLAGVVGRELTLPAGAQTLWVQVAREGRLLSPDALAKHCAGAAGTVKLPGGMAFRVELQIGEAR